jgi:hypothetical protein
MSHSSILCALCLCWVFAATSLAQSADDDLLLFVPLKADTQTKAVVGRGEPAGKPMAGGAAVIKEVEHWSSNLFLEAGRTDTALEFPAEGHFNAKAWTVSVVTIGRNWDLSAAQPDVLWKLWGEDQSLSLQRVGQAQLQVVYQRGSKRQTAAAPLTLDMQRLRHLAVTCSEGDLRFYVDGKAVGAAQRLDTQDASFQGVAFGQVGPGAAANNRLMAQFRIYGRGLSAGEVGRVFFTDSRIAPRRTAAIARTTRAISIDGRIDPQEWRDAVEITGLLEHRLENLGSRLLADHQTRFLVTYDEQNLYVAMISPTPPSAKADPHMTAGMGGLLKTTEIAHDAAVDHDDWFEVNVVQPQRGGDYYRLVTNGLNTTYDYTTGGYAPGSQLKGIDINWEPKWRVVANQVDMDNGWRVEAAIPLDSFRIPPPKPGDEWGMNFIRGWRQLMDVAHGWSSGERLEPDRDFHSGAYSCGIPGLVRFQGDEAVVVKVQSIGRPGHGRLEVVGRLVSTASQPRQVTLVLDSDSGEVNQRQALAVPAGGEVPFQLTASIKDFTTNRVTFQALEGSADLYTLELPIFPRQTLQVLGRSYPSSGLYKLEVDVSALSDVPLSELSAQARLRAAGGKTDLLESTAAPLPAYAHQFLMNVQPLPPGAYEAQVSIERSGKPLLQRVVKFNKKPLPEWFGNTIGISDEPPPPFEPVRRSDDTVRVWGRVYRFDGGLFPRQINVLGRDLLAQPIHLRLTAPDGQVYRSDAATASVQWTQTTRTRAQCVRSATVGPYVVTNTMWMEYDGFMWNELSIASPTRTPLHAASLVVAFTPEFSDVINPYDYSLRTTGKLKPEGWQGGMRPVWIGNGDGGLQWLAESDGDWSNRSKEQQLVVGVKDGAATLQVNFVDDATHLDTPLPLPFALVATPVKASDPQHRAHPAQWGYAWYPPGQTFQPGADGWFRRNDEEPGFTRTPPRADYALSPNLPKHFVKSYDAPYVTTGLALAEPDVHEQFADEWYARENDLVKPGVHMSVSQATRSFQDWFVWRYWRLYQNNPFASLYYDVSSEAVGLNRYAGFGYRRRDGSWVPAAAHLGARAIAQRLYTMVKLRHPDAIIKYHNSGLISMAYLGFCDYFVEGECTINMLTQDKADYIGKIRPDTYRAEMMGHNFGFVTDFLYQFTRSGMMSYDRMREIGPYMVDHIFGMQLLHDASHWGSYAPWEYTVRLERALRRHNWGPNYQMTPYWHQQIVQMPQNQFATFYFDKFQRKAICIFYNDTAQSGEQRVTVDFARLGFRDPARLLVDNDGHEIATVLKAHPTIWSMDDCDFKPNPDYWVRLEGQTLHMPLKPYDYQMIVVWER